MCTHARQAVFESVCVCPCAQVIFQRFAKDLEAVQGMYERGKRRPMLPRGTPPVTGHILWARQLLRRIEPPMTQCVTALLLLFFLIHVPILV